MVTSVSGLTFKAQPVWSDIPVARGIEQVQQTEGTVYNESLFLTEIAHKQFLSLRIIYLRKCVLTFAWAASLLLFATVWSVFTQFPYQPPLACFIAVTGILVVFLMKLHDAK